MNVGADMPLTVDLLGCPASVLLFNKCQKSLERDYDTIHQMQRDGSLYQLASA
jgi:hypothetical protein